MGEGRRVSSQLTGKMNVSLHGLLSCQGDIISNRHSVTHHKKDKEIVHARKCIKYCQILRKNYVRICIMEIDLQR